MQRIGAPGTRSPYHAGPGNSPTGRDNDHDKMEPALPRRIYVPTTFRWSNQSIENIGVRYKGNSSSRPNQRHNAVFLSSSARSRKSALFSAYSGLHPTMACNSAAYLANSWLQVFFMIWTSRHHDVTLPRCIWTVNTMVCMSMLNELIACLSKIILPMAVRSARAIKAERVVAWSRLYNSLIRTSVVTWSLEPKSPSAHTDARDVLELISRINQTSDDDFAKVMATGTSP